MLNPSYAPQSRAYPLIEAALARIATHPETARDPERLARKLGLTPAGLQAAVRNWSGAAPERFFSLFAPGGLARRLILPMGPRSRGRAAAPYPAVRLGVVAKAPPGEPLRHGVHETPFGFCLLGVLGEAVCWLSFREKSDLGRARRELLDFWRGVPALADEATTARWIPEIFGLPRGRPGAEIPVAVRGTPFQIAVWKALLTLPPGSVCTYGEIARAAGRPGAARAAGNAVAANPVSFLIPCHRVVPRGGGFGNYGGGRLRKRALLAWEAARFPAP